MADRAEVLVDTNPSTHTQVPEVLSVCSVQYKCVTDAQKRKSLLPGRCERVGPVIREGAGLLSGRRRCVHASTPTHPWHVPDCAAGGLSTLTRQAPSTPPWPRGRLWRPMAWRCRWRRAPAASCEFVHAAHTQHPACRPFTLLGRSMPNCHTCAAQTSACMPDSTGVCCACPVLVATSTQQHDESRLHRAC